MKSFLLFVLLISLFAYPQTSKSFYPWGASQGEIKKYEKSKFLHETRDILFYEITFVARKCTLLYEFERNKLTKTMIFFDKKYQANYANYLSILSDMTKKFGEFRTVNKWKNEYFKSDKMSWDKAVKVGDVDFMAFQDKKGIAVIYTVSDNEVSIIVYFYEPNLSEK